MKLIRKNPFQAKACALAITSIALLTVAASNAAAENVKVFNERVSGVPSGNPEIITDNVLSPEFAPGLIVEGLTRGAARWAAGIQPRMFASTSRARPAS